MKFSKKMVFVSACLCVFSILFTIDHKTAVGNPSQKPNADQALTLLKEGNARFVQGKSIHPNVDADRIKLASESNQADYAYATVISCSDSRVPVEILFDSGIMDLFVVRIAGNVCDTNEAGSIEYGVLHVHTPLLVILGHTQCGAVTAVTQAMSGHGHALERNIPPLVENITPAVQHAMNETPKDKPNELIPHAIEENVWRTMEDLFMMSAAVRNQVKEGKVKVVGAIYDMVTGTVKWLPENTVAELLTKVEANPKREMNPMAPEKHP